MQNVFETGNEAVDRMGRLNITGNIIPPSWYRTILKPTGKPNLNAIIILSDIVYWYRPVEIRDEATGQLVGMKKRFRADLLQRSYQQMAEQFGITKRDVTNAVVELEKLGVVKRVFRTLTINGQQYPNMLFLDLCVPHLEELTYPDEFGFYAEGASGRGCHSNEGDVSPKQERGVPKVRDTSDWICGGDPTQMGETNTKNTNRDFTGDYLLQSYQVVEERFKAQVDYEALKNDYPGDRIDELVGIAVDVLTSTADTIRVNRERKPAAVVKSQFWKLTMFHLQFVLKSLEECGSKAHNIRAVMVTALYNSVFTMEHYYNNLLSFQNAGERQDDGKEEKHDW